jgi:outer membrane lipoprotein LolB
VSRDLTQDRRTLRRLAAGLLFGLAAGCASLPPPTRAPDEAGRSWSGRFALTVSPSERAPDGDRSSGRFALTRLRDGTELSLISPLGTTLAQARADALGAELKTADGRVFRAADVDALTEQVFGWTVPIARLEAWLDGEIATVQERAPDATGRSRPVAGLDQGWTVRFEQWGERAPQRLTLTYPKRVTLRLIVDDR